MALFRMCSHVARLGETLSALLIRTLVGFETCMVVEMGLQVMLLCEGLWANWAGKWFDA